jgi:hypothetical protein
MAITAADLPRIKSEDSVILRPDRDALYHGCCGCGLLHRIVFSPRDGELALKFVNVGYELPADAVIDTKIVRGE